jgi:integrase
MARKAKRRTYRGCVFQPSYTVTLPDGAKELRKSRTFWIRYRDAQGIIRREAVGEDAAQAEDALAMRLTTAIDERHGLPTQSSATLPASELVKGYLDAQRSCVSAKHLEVIKLRIEAVVVGIHAVTVKDLTAERVDAFLSDYAEGDPEGEAPPPAPSTVNGYLQAVKAMLAWAVQRRKLPYNPLAGMKRRAVTTKARNRRPLSEDEAARLLSAGLEGPANRQSKAYKGAPLPLDVQADCARQGRRNALAYRLMLTAGLRLHEVQELRWTDIDLEAGALFIRGDKGDKLTGRVEEKEIPLPEDTVQALTAWKAETRPTENAVVVDIPSVFVRTLTEDLLAAGMAKRIPLDENKKPIPLNAEGNPERKPARWKIDTRDAAGRVIDCHALRHTFGTWLGKRPDVDPKTIQALMRHKTAALTFGVYVHQDRGRMKSAAANMPALTPKPCETAQAAALKTGTDNAPIEALPTRLVQDFRRGNAQALHTVALSQPSMACSQPSDSGSNPDGDTKTNKSRFCKHIERLSPSGAKLSISQRKVQTDYFEKCALFCIICCKPFRPKVLRKFKRFHGQVGNFAPLQAAGFDLESSCCGSIPQACGLLCVLLRRDLPADPHL